MKILLISEFPKGSLGLSYYNAFKQIGCDVSRFDLVKEYQSINPFAKYKYVNWILDNFFCSVLNSKLLERVKALNPELVFVIKGIFISPQTLKKVKELNNIVLINFNPDNPFNLNRGASNNLIRSAIPYYDCYFTWGKFLVPQLKSAGAKCVEYLPFAYDPTLHYPMNISNDEKNIYGSDIAFIGSWDKEREECLEQVQSYDIAIWGNSWEKLKTGSPLRRKWKERDVIGEDFAKVCSASKIILNLVRKQNDNAHNMRTFEIPACKGFMLTVRTVEQCEFFEEGKDISCFEDPNELKVKIDEFLKNENAIERFKMEANKKVQVHTYFERAKRILEVYRNLKAL